MHSVNDRAKALEAALKRAANLVEAARVADQERVALRLAPSLVTTPGPMAVVSSAVSAVMADPSVRGGITAAAATVITETVCQFDFY